MNATSHEPLNDTTTTATSMDEIDVIPMTAIAAAPKVSQEDDDQDHGEKVRATIGGGSRSDPPSLSPSSSFVPISMPSTSGGEERTMVTRDADSGVNYISSISASATIPAAADRTESLIQPPSMRGENEIPPPAAAETTANDSTTQMLEARILQLEQALRVLVTTLQGQLNQQNHDVPEQHQEIDEGRRHKQQQHGHTRGGSDSTTTTTGGSGATRSSSSSPPTPNSPWSDPTLSQWPPSNNHFLLESPDHVVHTLGRRRFYHQRTKHQLHHRKRKGKTMSMVLLDIDADENRGPRYVIPFTSSDLDVSYSDDITDRDSIKSGRVEEGVGGEEHDEVEDTVVPSAGRASAFENKSGHDISGTTNLICQGYSDEHWEALRLRREAGRSDRRAYSYSDRDFRSDSASFAKHPYRPTLDAMTKDPNSATSADVTFVEDGRELQEDIDIIIPDLSFAGVCLTSSRGRNLPVPQDQLADIDAKLDEAGIQYVEDCGMTVMGENIIAHSSSCHSTMSSDTAHTAKVVNTNSETSPLGSTNAKCKERSLSVASAKSNGGNSTLLQSAETTGDTTTSIPTSTTVTPKGLNSHKCAPPHNHISRDFTSPAESKSKNSQTMKEYVMNDLLNIDSLNQDGSATEDVDANMEEFLRIPPKLEFLMLFSLAVCMDSFLYVWTMLPLKLVWCVVCFACSMYSPKNGVRGVRFHRRHVYPLMQSIFILVVYSQVLCPISIGKLYHWIRGQAMLKLYVLIAIVEVFDRLLCSFGQDAWDSLYWNTTRRPRHPRTVVSIIVVGVYVTIHSLFLFVHVATLSVAVNSADNALVTLLISGNFAEIKSTVFKKYNKHHLFKITTSDICERFKLGLFLLLILFLNRFQGEMSSSMVKDYYSMCGIVFIAEMISDWIKHSFITKFNLIKSFVYFDYALVLSGDVTGIGHEGVNLDYTHAAVKRLGLAQIPLVCVTARYLHEAVRYAIVFQGNGDIDHPLAALAHLVADGSKWKFFKRVFQGMLVLVLFKIALGMCIRHVARGYLGVASNIVLQGDPSGRTSATGKTSKDSDNKKNP